MLDGQKVKYSIKIFKLSLSRKHRALVNLVNDNYTAHCSSKYQHLSLALDVDVFIYS